MTNIVRSTDVAALVRTAALLAEQGYAVGSVRIPENPWVDGAPYFATNAPLRDVSDARRSVR